MRREQREREFTEFYAGAATALRRTAYVVVRDWHVAEDHTTASTRWCPSASAGVACAPGASSRERPWPPCCVPDLGPVTFRAWEGNEQTLPPALYDKASGMSVSYGPRDHQLSVELAHGKGEAEGDPQEVCRAGLESGYDLECTVEPTADGDVVITRLDAMKPFTIQGQRVAGDWMAVPQDELATTDPDLLWFEQSVKVVKSETLVTYVGERVKAPTCDAADAAFEVPVPDLVEIGTDPVLVIPKPPLDDAGCGAWVLDPDQAHQLC